MVGLSVVYNFEAENPDLHSLKHVDAKRLTRFARFKGSLHRNGPDHRPKTIQGQLNRISPIGNTAESEASLLVALGHPHGFGLTRTTDLDQYSFERLVEFLRADEALHLLQRGDLLQSFDDVFRWRLYEAFQLTGLEALLT